MTAPLGILSSALRQAAVGCTAALQLVGVDGTTVRRISPSEWTDDLRMGDGSVLERCAGATLDVGCGPGRLSAALVRQGHLVLGVDVCVEAVRQARRRGVPAICADVFNPVPDEGHWQHILLADGNIGIGGDPVRLLERCLSLMTGDGEVLVELDPPGHLTWRGYVRLQYRQRQSAAFPWAGVAADTIGSQARYAGLRAREVWTEGARWFARLVR